MTDGCCACCRGGVGGRQRQDWGASSLADAMLGMLSETGSWGGACGASLDFRAVCFLCEEPTSALAAVSSLSLAFSTDEVPVNRTTRDCSAAVGDQLQL